MFDAQQDVPNERTEEEKLRAMYEVFESDPALKEWREQDEARIAADPDYALAVQEADKAAAAMSDQEIMQIYKSHPDIFQILLGM